jgi:hypothetical protein
VGAFNTTTLGKNDNSELGRYHDVITNPAAHAQYLEIDTPDQTTVGYWQLLAAQNHVPSNFRVVRNTFGWRNRCKTPSSSLPRRAGLGRWTCRPWASA